jgi:tRNA threonylcarbamoyladenosine biosynthesis protein TsaB
MTTSTPVLGIDASTGICTVALAVGDAVASRTLRQRQGQTRAVLAAVDALLAEAGLGRAGLDGVACTRGPGGFTGVRITTGIGQGLALGLDRPVVALSTLQVVAEAAQAAQPTATGTVVLLDARMGEVYGGVFGPAPAGRIGTQPIGDEWLGKPACPPVPAGRWVGAGSGFAAHPAIAGQARLEAVNADCHPDIAAAMPLAQQRLAAGEAVTAAALEPVYLRNRVAGADRRERG